MNGEHDDREPIPWVPVIVVALGLMVSLYACASARAQPAYLHLDAGERAVKQDVPAVSAQRKIRAPKRAYRYQRKARTLRGMKRTAKTVSRIVSHETQTDAPIRPKPVPTQAFAPIVLPANTEPVEPPAVRFPFERFETNFTPMAERPAAAAPPIPVEVRSRMLPWVIVLAGTFFLLCAAIIFFGMEREQRARLPRREPRFDPPVRHDAPRARVLVLDHYRRRKLA